MPARTAPPASWQVLMSVVGAGGTLMALALALYVLALAATWPRRAPHAAQLDLGLPAANLASAVPDRARAWAGPIAILILVGTMALFTVLAFEMMKALPLAAPGGGNH